MLQETASLPDLPVSVGGDHGGSGGAGTCARITRQRYFLPLEAYDSMDAVHGPFSEDFRWVRMQAEGDPIEISPAQAAVFKVLRNFGGQSQEAHVIMARAEFNSDKPIDAFKVKTQRRKQITCAPPDRARCSTYMGRAPDV